MTNVSGPAHQLLNGSILVPELPGGEVVTVAVAASLLPAGALSMTPNTTALYVSALRSSLDASGGPAAAAADFNAAVGTGADALRASHVAAWAAIWTSG